MVVRPLHFLQPSRHSSLSDEVVLCMEASAPTAVREDSRLDLCTHVGVEIPAGLWRYEQSSDVCCICRLGSYASKRQWLFVVYPFNFLTKDSVYSRQREAVSR